MWDDDCGEGVVVFCYVRQFVFYSSNCKVAVTAAPGIKSDALGG